MKSIDIQIAWEVIELYQLLKLARVVETGGQAKEVIRLGEVGLNGNTATELRKKVRSGDSVRYLDFEIRVTAS